MRSLKHILLPLLILGAPLAAQAQTTLPGLTEPVTVIRDANGIPHIQAREDLDAFYMQGWLHAQDRLFQMDLFRRSAKGTLAELFGPSAVEQDFMARTLGLDRAAARSLAAHSQATQAILTAYSNGVNAYIDQAEANNLLPPEYGALELTQVADWAPLDSLLVAKAIGVQTSLLATHDIDLTLALAAYQVTGQLLGASNPALGFDGTALFFEDLFRSAPFDPASTVPDAETAGLTTKQAKVSSGMAGDISKRLGPKALKQARQFVKQMRDLPRIPGVPTANDSGAGGSNTWVVSGAHTSNGHPILANDAHLTLQNPAIFHQVHLASPGMDVSGSSLPGTPCIVRGQNRHLAWGLTNSRLDITDNYKETIVPYANSPSRLATMHNGVAEPIIPVPQQYSVNLPNDGKPNNVVPASLILTPQELARISLVLIVPRRNHGALITAPEFDPDSGYLTALSIQSIAFGATQDLEGFCNLNRATNLAEFKSALQLIDFVSQNVTYADSKGNIAYFITGEVPLREDLQNPVSGQPIMPPFLIREGSGGQDWIPITGDLPQNQVSPFKILPFEEMPQTENPLTGVIVNANNDQAGNTLDNNPLNQLRPGGGIYYLNWGGHNFSIRAGRITRMIEARLARGKNKISLGNTKAMQADTVLGDAEVLAPFIINAFDNATRTGASPVLAALASDARVSEAVNRIRHWNFTTPTGIPEGYDADSDSNEIEASVAASIYSVWRGRMAATAIDAVLDAISVPQVLAALGLEEMPRPGAREELVTALKHLLDNDGVSVSGLNFFMLPEIPDPAVRRDIVVLQSLSDALDQLASDAFAPAFGNSTNQDDYRWGKLHRIVFEHPLGSAAEHFNVPPAFGLFPAPLAGLSGIPTDGGFETVDVGPPIDNNIRVTDSDSFMFVHGPTGRFVSKLVPGKVWSETSLPGGASAVPFSPFYLNLLEPWLQNRTYRLFMLPDDIQANAFMTQVFVPPAP